jgi:hypothetical protein
VRTIVVLAVALGIFRLDLSHANAGGAAAVLAPMTCTLDGVRASLIDGRGVAEVAPDLLALAATGPVLVPAGLAAFRWAERRAKRLGLLKRSG